MIIYEDVEGQNQVLCSVRPGVGLEEVGMRGCVGWLVRAVGVDRDSCVGYIYAREEVDLTPLERAWPSVALS